MYELSGSKLLNTTTGIQSRSDTFEESMVGYDFHQLGITRILSSVRLILDEKAGKEIHESARSRFSKTISTKKFPLSDAPSNTSGPINRKKIADLFLLTTISATS